MVAWVLLLAILVTSGACRAGRTPQSSPVSRSGTLRVALHTEPRTLNPNAAGDETAYVVSASLFSRLIVTDVDGRLLPDLAERWSVDAGHVEYTFSLRRGVRWHDGAPFSAEDVRWTLEALRSAAGPSRHLAERIQRIDVPDPHTIRIRLAEPWAPFLAALSQFDVAILPRHRYTGGNWQSDPDNMRPIGTGPFKFAGWRPGEALRLDANETYFKAGPFVDHVEYRFVSDPARASEMMLAGQADLLIGRPRASDLDRLSHTSHLAVFRTPSNGRYYGLFNLKRAPFNDRRARLAANHASDRRLLVSHALGGMGAPALGFYTPTVPWAYNEDARVPRHDARLAIDLLRASGARGRRAVVVAPNATPYTSLARELVRQWREVGFDAVVSLFDPADFIDVMTSSETDWDLVLLGGGNGPDPDVLRVRFASDGLFSFSGFANPRFDAAVRAGGRHLQLPDRAAAYRSAQAILAEDLPILPIAETVRVTVCSRRLYGLPQSEARGLVADYDYSLVRLEP